MNTFYNCTYSYGEVGGRGLGAGRDLDLFILQFDVGLHGTSYTLRYCIRGRLDSVLGLIKDTLILALP